MLWPRFMKVLMQATFEDILTGVLFCILYLLPIILASALANQVIK